MRRSNAAKLCCHARQEQKLTHFVHKLRRCLFHDVVLLKQMISQRICMLRALWILIIFEVQSNLQIEETSKIFTDSFLSWKDSELLDFGKITNESQCGGMVPMYLYCNEFWGRSAWKMMSNWESLLMIGWQTWTMPAVFWIREALSCRFWSIVALMNTFFAFNCWSDGEVPFGDSALAISSKTGNVFEIPLSSAQRMSQISWYRRLRGKGDFNRKRHTWRFISARSTGSLKKSLMIWLAFLATVRTL